MQPLPKKGRRAVEPQLSFAVNIQSEASLLPTAVATPRGLGGAVPPTATTALAGPFSFQAVPLVGGALAVAGPVAPQKTPREQLEEYLARVLTQESKAAEISKTEDFLVCGPPPPASLQREQGAKQQPQSASTVQAESLVPKAPPRLPPSNPSTMMFAPGSMVVTAAAPTVGRPMPLIVEETSVSLFENSGSLTVPTPPPGARDGDVTETFESLMTADEQKGRRGSNKTNGTTLATDHQEIQKRIAAHRQKLADAKKERENPVDAARNEKKKAELFRKAELDKLRKELYAWNAKLKIDAEEDRKQKQGAMDSV